ncbi:cyclophilin-like fold protein [Angelakisella massiliensis]|uniref:cyclophilin-like fold protein n=1 Tax=Angelakisella massiliensis TaxID=1871018 RepID=UPI0024B085EF|nr:cyclophilin-like fold protein [Angelakisella massiliensis]
MITKILACWIALTVVLTGCGAVTETVSGSSAGQGAESMAQQPASVSAEQSEQPSEPQQEQESQQELEQESQQEPGPELQQQPAEEAVQSTGQEEAEIMLQIQVGDTLLTAALEDNSSADALKEMLSEGPLTIEVENYGGFEKVGTLPESLPRNDTQMTAQPGDIMLYQGNSIVFFHGSNSWSYTKLGTIEQTGDLDLKEVLGGQESTVTLSLG